MNFNTQQSHSCSSHTQSFVTHASPYEIHLVHVFSERVQSAQIITMITTRSRCCFYLSSNKQLRHTPQDTSDHIPHKKRILRKHTRAMTLTNHNHPTSPSYPHSTTQFPSSRPYLINIVYVQSFHEAKSLL